MNEQEQAAHPAHEPRSGAVRFRIFYFVDEKSYAQDVTAETLEDAEAQARANVQSEWIRLPHNDRMMHLRTATITKLEFMAVAPRG